MLHDKEAIEEAKDYLETGGLGEVIGLASMANQEGSSHVQMTTDLALALCLLADETIKKRKVN